MDILKAKLKEAEKRAIFAEKSVKSYLEELEMREGIFMKFLYTITYMIIFHFNQFFFSDRLRKEKEKFKYICDDLDSTFAELTGY